MANQYNSKVVLSTGEVLIDLTLDDVAEQYVQKDIKFHDKSGAPKVGTNTKTVDASEVTTSPSEVLAGKPFGKGNRIEVGTMPNIGSAQGEISTKEGQYSIPQGYHDGGGKVGISGNEKAKLIPSNIKEGVTILGVTGDYGADDISSQAKEITASFADQTVVPDSDYTFLTSVLVKAMPVVRQDNSAGGVTVTIG